MADSPSPTASTEPKRSSERRKNQKEFTMPTRADVWDKISDVPTTGINNLKPRKLVNDFVGVQSRYNYDAAYTSGEESPFTVSDDDSDAYNKSKSRQQKFAKKRNTEKGRLKKHRSSESFESSDDSTAKSKKVQNKVKGTLKKLHMKSSSQKLKVDSPLSSDSEHESALRSCPKRATVLDSSDSGRDKNSEKPVKMFSITKKKKNISVIDSSSSNNNSDNERKSRTTKSSSFGEKDKKPKRGAIGKKSKSALAKQDSIDDATKGSSSSLSVSKKSLDVKGQKSSLSSEHSGSVTDDKTHESLINSESDGDFSFDTLKKKTKSNVIESD